MNHNGNASGHSDEPHALAVVIKAVCAWCGTTLREGIEPPSHGICDPCIAKLCGITMEELFARRAEWEAELQRRADEPPDPDKWSPPKGD